MNAGQQTVCNQDTHMCWTHTMKSKFMGKKKIKELEKEILFLVMAFNKNVSLLHGQIISNTNDGITTRFRSNFFFSIPAVVIFRQRMCNTHHPKNTKWLLFFFIVLNVYMSSIHFFPSSLTIFGRVANQRKKEKKTDKDYPARSTVIILCFILLGKEGYGW